MAQTVAGSLREGEARAGQTWAAHWVSRANKIDLGTLACLHVPVCGIAGYKAAGNLGRVWRGRDTQGGCGQEIILACEWEVGPLEAEPVRGPVCEHERDGVGLASARVLGVCSHNSKPCLC